LKLRPYQQESADAIWSSLRRGLQPCVQLPTGTGKSLVIASVADRIRSKGGVVWVVAHVKELIDQNYKTLDRFAGAEGVGVICSGLNRKDEGESITFGTVQSLYRGALKKIYKPPNAIIIDEAHRIPMHKDGKFYNGLLNSYPEASRIGLTATPWRMDGGVIYGEHEGTWFNDLCYAKSVPEMVELEFLCPLIGVETEVQLDLKGVHKTAGDYKQSEVAERETDMWLDAVVKSVKHLAEKRNKIAVYCPTVKAAENAAKAFNKAGWLASVVSGQTNDRHDVIDEWKHGDVRVLCSVDILTTGFDHPPLDCIVVLRPTESSSLWVQIMGRATRIHEGKKNALILDYVGNLARLGGIGMMEDFVVERKGKVSTTKKATGKPKVEKKKPNTLSSADPMAGKAGGITVLVNSVSYLVIKSKNQAGKSMVMACYDCQTEEGYTLSVNDFICCEYSGYARQKAEAWAMRRGSNYLPFRAHEAINFCYALPSPRKLVVQRNGRYFNIQKEIF